MEVEIMDLSVLPPRYEYRCLLGEGGMGQVHRVFDREREEEVALKTLLNPSDDGLFLFKQEFWVMSSLNHPNLVAAHDYGEFTDGTPYLTMALVEGEDLDTRLPLPEADVRALLPGILAALAYLHGRGYVHGDLKPENVRLEAGGRVRLMDLGLLERSGRVGGEIRGSLSYMAPEAIRRGTVDPRSDLYALGAVLYHVLAGRPPFENDEAAGVVALLRAHLEVRPESLRRIVPEVTREFEATVMRLLEKDPADRFPDVSALLSTLGLVAEGPAEVGLLGSPIIGREEAERAIDRVVGGLSAGGPDEQTSLWLVGAAGLGKTRLLGQARAQAQLQGLTAVGTQGLGLDAPPYQALRPWLKALTAVPSVVRDRLASVLLRLVPDLAGAYPGLQPASALDGSQERLRLHAAIAELAIATWPSALWLVDDVDALDAASREMVAFLVAQGAHRRGWRWIYTAAAPPDLAEKPAFLGPVVTLMPLEEDEIVEMAGALLGQADLPRAATERLGSVTGGNPGMIALVLGHWVRMGALQRSAGRWEASAEEAFELPGGLHVVLDARFQALTADERLVGQTAALLGASASLPWLAALVPISEAAFFGALAALEVAEVLVREESTFRFLRPAQAAALRAAWPEADARRLHTAAARWQEMRLGLAPDAPDLQLSDTLPIASHYLAGEEPLAALPWVLAVAARANALYVMNTTEAVLRRALALDDLPLAALGALQGYLVHLYRFQGKIDEAQGLLEQAILPPLREQGDPALAGFLVTLGVIHQMKGRYPQALTAFAEAINLADAANDPSTGVRARIFAGRVAYFSGETGTAKTHLSSAVRRARDLAGGTDRDIRVTLASALSLYGYVLASSDSASRAEGLTLLAESIAINEEIGNLYELHEALNNRGNVYLAGGHLDEARQAFEACLTLCERMGTANETVFALLNIAAVQLELGQLGAAQVHARKAVEMARRQGRKFPEGFASAVEGLALVYLGDLVGGVERLTHGVALAREIANRYLELCLLAYWAEALVHLGRFTEAESTVARARELAAAIQNDEQGAKLDRLDAALAVLTWRPEAAALLSALLETTRAQNQTVGLAHALRWQADRLLKDRQADVAFTLLSEARQLAGQGELVLLQAEVEELWGRGLIGVDVAGAIAHFQASLALARASGCRVVEIAAQAGLGAADPAERLHRLEAPRRLEALVASLDPAERQDFLAWPERAAVAQMGKDERGPYAADRLQHLTDLIATLGAQSDLPTIMAQALAALVGIAGAERGFLLLYKGFEVTQQIFHGMDEADGDEFSSSLAYQVLWSGEPLFVEDASTHLEFANRKSVQSLSLRSVVCVPINDGNETIGVMMADSRRINAGFTEEDFELAKALGHQVGVTISNVRRLQRYKNGYAEYERLHRLALALVGVRTRTALMSAVAAEVLPLCEADRVLLLEGPDLSCSEGADHAGASLSGKAVEFSHSVSQWVYEHGEPLYLLDAQGDEYFQAKKSVMALGLRTIYAVPITFEGARLGVLYLDQGRMADENPTALHTLARVGDLVGAFLGREPERTRL